MTVTVSVGDNVTSSGVFCCLGFAHPCLSLQNEARAALDDTGGVDTDEPTCG